jgi:hypothetical protein
MAVRTPSVTEEIRDTLTKALDVRIDGVFERFDGSPDERRNEMAKLNRAKEYVQRLPGGKTLRAVEAPAGGEEAKPPRATRARSAGAGTAAGKEDAR